MWLGLLFIVTPPDIRGMGNNPNQYERKVNSPPRMLDHGSRKRVESRRSLTGIQLRLSKDPPTLTDHNSDPTLSDYNSHMTVLAR